VKTVTYESRNQVITAQMNPDEVRKWLARWDEVRDRIDEETRALPPEAKLRQVSGLRGAASLFESSAERERENQRVRELWIRLHAHERQ